MNIVIGCVCEVLEGGGGGAGFCSHSSAHGFSCTTGNDGQVIDHFTHAPRAVSQILKHAFQTALYSNVLLV